MTRFDELGTLLGVWAHPDDEAYLMGGVMALATDAGRRVVCITATRGDAGESADPDRWPVERLGEIREGELRECLGILGVSDHEWLGLPDGGLADIDPEGPIERIAVAIERVRPDTVMTFGPDGMTGHPDHQTVSAWTETAFDRAAPNGARLLFATKTDEWARAFAEVNTDIFPGGPPSIPADEAWNLVLDDEILERKVRALEAQASQITGTISMFGRERFAEWVREETFRQVRPAR